MKTIKLNINKVTLAVLLIITNYNSIHAQQSTKPNRKKIAVINIDVNNLKITKKEVVDFIRMELEKIDTFEVMDRYDTKSILTQNKIVYDDVYGKSGLIEIGNFLKQDYVIAGTVEKISDIIFITYRLIDVKEDKIIKTHMQEYLSLENEITTMLKSSLKLLLNYTVDDAIIDKLTKKYDYDNQINNPNESKIKSGGPRMGLVIIGGESARVLQLSKSEHGFDASPVMSLIGYQIEYTYLNTKRIQALCEIVPMLSGLEQNMFKPTFNILNGIRDSHSGFEFAFGPSIGFSLRKDYVTYNGKEMRAEDYKNNYPNGANLNTYSRLDNGGDLNLDISMVIGIGKTFIAGKLNLPVNLFFSIPNKDGIFVGLSFGYNIKK